MQAQTTLNALLAKLPEEVDVSTINFTICLKQKKRLTLNTLYIGLHDNSLLVFLESPLHPPTTHTYKQLTTEDLLEVVDTFIHSPNK
jgi:hypothetical protein